LRVAREGERALLLARQGKRFIVTLRHGERLHTHKGMLDHDALIGLAYGSPVQSHTGELFYLMPPTIHDELMAIRRASQVIYPKELGEILLRLDVAPGKRVIEAGTGSGAMTMALAHAVQPDGHVFSYELRADMIALAKQNLARLGLEHLVDLIARDIAGGFDQREVDALFLDVRSPWEYLDQVALALSDGGQLGVLVPTANQIIAMLETLEGSPFVDVDVMEIWHRHYRPVPGRLRPEDVMVGHTGYLLFARKIRREPPSAQPLVLLGEDGSPEAAPRL